MGTCRRRRRALRRGRRLESEPVPGLGKPWRKNLARAGLREIQIHVARRTYSYPGPKQEYVDGLLKLTVDDARELAAVLALAEAG